MLSVDEGVAAVRLARRALEAALHAPSAPESLSSVEAERLPAVFNEPRGVFVTLKRHPSGMLRGCIGYPLPVLPLRSALVRATVSAAVEDYRFRPVPASELPRLTIEVSVLTPPEPLQFSTPEEAIRAVKVGRDGLIVDGLGSSGLLLPQVAPEEGWSAEELLDGTCEKAGLPPRSWQDPRVRIRRFEAEIFHEVSPGGDVVREGSPEATTDAPRARRK
ncbi:MAG TPA: TIGR00296 family protein [Thermoplasmata archaeon]|nr:TIGR00296 family protein [Thermoplasmata archaeon]